MTDTIRVAVRIRPFIQSEIDRGCQKCLEVTPGEPQIVISNTGKAFTFNHVFSSEVSQEEFYNTAIEGMVKNIFEGYNVTILAYGQTGSGKTYSMGTNYDGIENVGVIPRAVHDIFEIVNSKKDWDIKIVVSFIELYQEQLYDLLSNKERSQTTVDIREDCKTVKVVGVSEKLVTNAEETLDYLMQGSLRRAIGATAMNSHSSRSHTIFTLSIQQQLKNDSNTATVAKFHLVDLAGSERNKKTQATGERFKEGVNINKGLLALGNVISQLGDGNTASYVGYRDSKLTRLLQDSLGGNSMTLMIACVSPADYNLDETFSTLRYADRARKIKNKPIINQNPQVAKINRLNKLIQDLRLALANREVSTIHSSECEDLIQRNQLLQEKIRDLTEKLSANLSQIVFMHEKTELAEKASESIKQSVDIVLENMTQLLESFNEDSFDKEKLRTELEAIYYKILDIIKGQKRASEEIFNYEMSLHSKENLTKEKEEDLDNEISDTHKTENLADYDEKHAEHALIQAERIDEVENINKELAIKEHLVSQLLKNNPHAIDYSKELYEMEQEIKTLQIEKDELLLALQNAQESKVGLKSIETRNNKIQELERKMADLTRKHSKFIKEKEKSDQQIKTLSKEIQSLKQTRVKLVRQMRSEADRFTKWQQSRERELNKLKDQDRKRANQMARLQIQHDKTQNVLKRKMEEASAANKRLKEALELQRRGNQRRQKTNNSKIEVQTWVTQELEVLSSTVEAKHSLEKLMQDRTTLVTQLNNLNNDTNVIKDIKEITELSECLNLRNAQIADLQQKIIEADQENQENTILNMIHTMSDAKLALKTLLEFTENEKKKQCFEKFQYKDLKEENSILEKNLIEARQREQKLQEELELHKNRSNTPEKKVLAEKNVNHRKKKADVYVNEINSSFEDSVTEDDVSQDPDWRNTPLYSRIKKLWNTTNNPRESLKRPSSEEICCSCKTKCITRICSCRKNGVACSSKCNCISETCQNKSQENIPNGLLIYDDQQEDFTKKPRLTEEQCKSS